MVSLLASRNCDFCQHLSTLSPDLAVLTSVDTFGCRASGISAFRKVVRHQNRYSSRRERSKSVVNTCQHFPQISKCWDLEISGFKKCWQDLVLTTVLLRSRRLLNRFWCRKTFLKAEIPLLRTVQSTIPEHCTREAHGSQTCQHLSTLSLVF